MQLPALGPDILQRMVDLLRLFNTRACQLVLGAEDMQRIAALECGDRQVSPDGLAPAWD